MKKLMDILLCIGICLVIPSGILAVIYEIFIWDKSIFPDWLYNTMLTTGLIGVLFTVVAVIMCHKRGGLD